jgi:hypothetical protein
MPATVNEGPWGYYHRPHQAANALGGERFVDVRLGALAAGEG